MTAKRVNFMRNETSVTTKDVARWLLGEVRLEGPLDRHQTAEELEDMFGPGVFTATVIVAPPGTHRVRA
jgi:hypothetical protein